MWKPMSRLAITVHNSEQKCMCGFGWFDASVAQTFLVIHMWVCLLVSEVLLHNCLNSYSGKAYTKNSLSL